MNDEIKEAFPKEFYINKKMEMVVEITLENLNKIADYVTDLQERFNKAIEYINIQKKTISKWQADLFNEDRDNKSKLKVGTFMWNVDELLDILKGDDEND